MPPVCASVAQIAFQHFHGQIIIPLNTAAGPIGPQLAVDRFALCPV